LTDLFFDPEDEGDMFLWNISWFSTGYMVLEDWNLNVM
jgi:hypothetical protein